MSWWDWELREKLATYLDNDKLIEAKSLLNAQAEYFIKLANDEQHRNYVKESCERKARWLIQSAFALDEIQTIERQIKKERELIRTIDAELLSHMQSLQKHLTYYAEIAQVFSEIGYGLPSRRPVCYATAFTSRPYATAELYLQAFGYPGTSPLIGWRKGRPDIYDTIEKTGHCHWPFLPLIRNSDWQQYLYSAISYCEELIASARTYANTQDLLRVSKTLSNSSVDDRDLSLIKSLIYQAHKSYEHRQTTKYSIVSEIMDIDFFYDCLATCEKSSAMVQFNSPTLLWGGPPAYPVGVQPNWSRIQQNQ